MKITALVSAYYSAQFISDRLDNLQSLAPKPFIIVVAQTGSTELQEAQSRGIKTIETEYIPTIYKAWNAAIQASDGKYITTANTDDLFDLQGWDAMVRTLDSIPEVDIVHGDSIVDDGKTSYLWERQGESVSLTSFRIGSMPMWRRSLHDRFGMFDPSYVVSGDYEFFLRCTRGGARVLHIPQVVGTYRRRDDSLEKRNREIHRAENERLRELYAKKSS